MPTDFEPEVISSVTLSSEFQKKPRPDIEHQRIRGIKKGCEYIFCTFYPNRGGETDIYRARSTHPGDVYPDWKGGEEGAMWDGVHRGLIPPGPYSNWVPSPHWRLSCWIPGPGLSLTDDPPYPCVIGDPEIGQCDPDPLGGAWSHDGTLFPLEIEGTETPDVCDGVDSSRMGAGGGMAELILHPLP